MLLLLSQLLGYGEFVFFNKIIGNMIFFSISLPVQKLKPLMNLGRMKS